MSKEYTIKIEGVITILANDDLNIKNVPIKLDVYDFQEDPDSSVLDVLETDITHKEISVEVNLN